MCFCGSRAALVLRDAPEASDVLSIPPGSLLAARDGPASCACFTCVGLSRWASAPPTATQHRPLPLSRLPPLPPGPAPSFFLPGGRVHVGLAPARFSVGTGLLQ